MKPVKTEYYVHFDNRSLWFISNCINEAVAKAKEMKGTVAILNGKVFEFIEDFRIPATGLAF